MIIVQTPLRVSLFGGGTDFRDYFLAEGGCVLSFAINKYIYVTIKSRFDDLLRVGYTQTEMVADIDQIQHELIREALRLTGIDQGVEVTTMGDIPSAGSGLGSSSTVTVGALLAMYTLQGELVTAGRLAEEACQIEIDTLGKPIGVQDQYIAAFGGLRFFEFHTDGQITCQRAATDDNLLRRLNQNFLLYFTGATRRSATVLTEQKANIASRLGILSQMKDLARQARDELMKGNLDEIGRLMDVNWGLKKQLASKISNPAIDELYQTARRAGALGGKIAGAGGGGFMMLYCPVEQQEPVREALKGLQELPFKVERDGAKVIFNYIHP